MAERFVPPALRPSLRPSLPWLAIATLAAILSGLLMLGALWCIVCLMGKPSADWAIAAGVLWLAGAALAAAGSWLSHAAEAGFAARLRRQVAGHLVRLPPSTLERHGGEALRRLVSDDVAALHHMVAHLPLEAATFAVVPLASIILLVAIAGPMALLVLLPGTLAALYYSVLMPQVAAHHGAERMRVMNEIIAAADDYARGIRVSRIYGAQSGALAAFRGATGRFTEGMVAWVGKVATPAAIAVALMQAVATFAIAYAVSYQRDASVLAASLLYSLAIVTPALRLGHGLDYVAAGRAAAGRIATVLREPVVSSGVVTAVPKEAVIDAGIETVDVSLRAGGQQLVSGLTQRFRPGALTAMTGPSGVGKTTLLRALVGLEPVSSGSIRFGGVDIISLDETTRHLAILLVPQGGDILPVSVRENLALGAPGASDAQYLAALRQAQIEIDLDADAARLSGGERQRIGLAQVFLTSASVILLDEPTSALDRTASKGLMVALRRLAQSQGKTIVMVTHDPALAAEADAHIPLKRAADDEVLP